MFVFLWLCRLTQSVSSITKERFRLRGDPYFYTKPKHFLFDPILPSKEEKPKQQSKHVPLISSYLAKGPDTKTFMNIDDFREFLIKNGVSSIDASKISKRMSYSAKIRTIIHTFNASCSKKEKKRLCIGVV